MTTRQDILGPGFTARTLELRGGNIATLVHHPATGKPRGAVLYLHGFVDYFFQVHLAQLFTDHGWDFYALDLRRYGRSLRESDIPWFTTDLAEYDEELDLAIEGIRAAGHTRIIAMGHSTGGLILPLWLARKNPMPVDALVLNSPWLDLQYDRFNRTIGTLVVDLVGRFRPTMPLPQKLTAVYAESIHKDRHGEWDFNTDWKPLSGVDTLAGWFRTVRRGHARLHRGLGLPLPVLLMHSDSSRLDLQTWSPAAMIADTVLDVAQMDQWAPQIGPDVTTAVIPGGMHDLFLSAAPVREHAARKLIAWLNATFG